MYFFVFYLHFLSIFCIFTKNEKKEKIQKIRMQLLKNTKYKKNTNQQFQKYKIQKKIRTQNFKNTKYKEKTNSKISQRANPVFTFGNQEPKYKKNTKPTSCIFQTLQFWFCIFGLYFFRNFFVFLNIGRRPFCSHPGQLKQKWYVIMLLQLRFLVMSTSIGVLDKGSTFAHRALRVRNPSGEFQESGLHFTQCLPGSHHKNFRREAWQPETLIGTVPSDRNPNVTSKPKQNGGPA